VEEERKTLNFILNSGAEYNRLVSFFYPRTIDTVLTLQREKKEGRKNAKRIKSKIKDFKTVTSSFIFDKEEEFVKEQK
jgi:hypothetical protein